MKIKFGPYNTDWEWRDLRPLYGLSHVDRVADRHEEENIRFLNTAITSFTDIGILKAYHTGC